MDEKYIIGLQKGSYSDFNKLYDLYADRLYGFAYNLTHSEEMAEEIVQEVFLKIWQMREHLSPEYSFRSFLFTIAKNKFLNDLRNRLTLLSYDEYAAQFDSAGEGEVCLFHHAEILSHVYSHETEFLIYQQNYPQEHIRVCIRSFST